MPVARCNIITTSGELSSISNSVPLKTEPAKPEKTKTGWFKNKRNKAKETKAEEKKNEGAIPGGAAPVTETVPQETTEIKDETGGIAD